MVGKTYLRYVVGPQGGCIASNAALTIDSAVAPAVYQPTRGGGNASSNNSSSNVPASVLFVPALEAVRVVSVRSGAVLHTLVPAEAKMPVEVTSLRVFPLGADKISSSNNSTTTAVVNALSSDLARRTETEGWMLLVGYNNGFFACFTCGETANYGKPVCRLYALGHRVDTAVLASAVDASRTLACSAGQDTDLTVWDLMGQEAMYRLRGHRGGVVAVHFIPPGRGGAAAATAAASLSSSSLSANNSSSSRSNSGSSADTLLVSAAADGLLKVWNLSLRQCIQTVVASDAQVTSMAMDLSGRRLFCGVRESFIKVYSIAGPETAAASPSYPSSSSSMIVNGSAADTVLADHGTLPRKYHKPITAFSFSPDWKFILATTSKTIEVYRVLTAEETKKKVYRKKRRQQKSTAGNNGNNANKADDDDDDDDDEVEGEKKKQPAGKKRARDKHNSEDDDDDDEQSALQTASEELTLLRTFFLTSQTQPNRKVRSACFIPSHQSRGGGATTSGEDDASSALHIAVTFNNNAIQTYTTGLTLSEVAGGATWALTDLKPRLSFDSKGHQSDIRALTFAENDSALLSMSREKIIMWSVTMRADRIESSYTDNNDFYDMQEANLARVDFKGSLNPCGVVLLNAGASSSGGDVTGGGDGKSGTGAGDGVAMAAVSANMCCVGLSDGTVALVDVASSETLVTETNFHTGGVKGVTKKPDDSGFLTVGADRRIALWTIGLMKDGRTATLVLATEIELTELPLFATFSPDNRFLGVGIQNNNIQLFFADSLKPYLSLFGHKLPPTSMSFSSDGTLAASVGTDKSLRFWGTDFGDCHRAIHAHDDYVTAVEFVKDTHLVVTASLDGSVKHWDGDNWTMIQYSRVHQHGLWALAVTRNATCVATAGADKCIRCFFRGQDIIVPEEEEERMGQEAADEEAARRTAMQRLNSSAEDGNGGVVVSEVGVAGQPTVATAEAGERLMEALDLVSVELQKRANPEDTSPAHPLMATMSPWEYLWSVIAAIRPSEMRHALASLTSLHADALLDFLAGMLTAKAVLDYEIAARIVLGLVGPAPSTTASGAGAAALALLRASAVNADGSAVLGARRLEGLRRCIAAGLDHCSGRMDQNIAGLQFVRQHLQTAEHVKFFDLSKMQGHKKQYHSRALTNKKDGE